MKRFIQVILIAIVAVAATSIVWAAKDPAPGSRDDPIITKSYVDRYAAWRRVQIPSGGTFEVAEGTEWVVAYAAVFDLTLGAPLGVTPLITAHHYLCAASESFTISFIGETQLLVRGG